MCLPQVEDLDCLIDSTLCLTELVFPERYVLRVVQGFSFTRIPFLFSSPASSPSYFSSGSCGVPMYFGLHHQLHIFTWSTPLTPTRIPVTWARRRVGEALTAGREAEEYSKSPGDKPIMWEVWVDRHWQGHMGVGWHDTQLPTQVSGNDSWDWGKGREGHWEKIMVGIGHSQSHGS